MHVIFMAVQFSCHGSSGVFERNGIVPKHLEITMPGGSHGHAVCNIRELSKIMLLRALHSCT